MTKYDLQWMAWSNIHVKNVFVKTARIRVTHNTNQYSLVIAYVHERGIYVNNNLY